MAITITIVPQEFPSTHWSRILLATDADKAVGRSALETLLRAYYGPLQTHLMFRFRVSPEQAEDWLQGFIERKILERQLLGKADRDRGRFRAFLLTALDCYVLDELDRAQRQSRRPRGGTVSLEGLDAVREMPGAGQQADPFELEWARLVLTQALSGLREYYAGKDRLEIWEAFNRGFLGPLLDGEAWSSQNELAAVLGLQNAAQVSNAIATAKRRFKSVLRSVIARYARDETEIDAEIRELKAILSRSH